MTSKLSISQRDVYEKIVKAHSNFKKSPKERITEPYVQTRLKNLEDLWIRFTTVHQEILDKADDWAKLQDTDYVKGDLYEKTEEAYFDYKCELSNFQLTTVPKGSSQINSSIAWKLPKISIPNFSGQYSEWVTFRDLFRSLVHSNPSLDDVQRLHYLKSYLTGEAEQLIRQLPITAANYEECWNQLNARYNNKKYLANCILKRLMGQKSASSESAATLKDLADTTADCLHGLKNIGVNVETWDIIIIHIIANKLDMETRKQWELRVSLDKSDILPTFEQFRDFLQSRFRALESLEPTTKCRASNPTQSHPNKYKVMHVANIVCEYCNESHKLFTCKKFCKDDVIRRREFVFSKRLCFNCLGSNHSARYCPSKLTCRVCKGKHHSLLHPTGSGGVGSPHNFNTGVSVPGEVTSGSSTGKSPANSSVVESAPVVSCFGKLPVQRQVFLATALVRAESSKGQSYLIRALLDQGSQASFITEATVQYLGLKRYPVKGVVSGLEGKNTTVSKFMADVKIYSRFDNNKFIKTQAYVLKSITTLLPNQKIELEEMSWLDQSFPLADPQYYTPNKIDMLMGAEIYSQIIENGIRKGPRGNILAQATSLGWIVSGTCLKSQASSANVIAMHLCVEDNDLLKRFWEMEADPKSQKRMMTEEEESCEQFFAKTTQRDIDGRYVVKLPFKMDVAKCINGNSREIAEKRLNALYTRFKKDEDLKNKYQDVMEEYLRLGYMEKVPKTETDNTEGVYIPHHPVVKNDKDTTKVRIVYDASCKYKNGISLNDILMIGPTLQPELRHLLMRWRKYPICLAADIEKMYCQVKVAEVDTNYQRLLWKNGVYERVEDYRLLRVTFGTAAAPYLAVKSLQQLAHDEGAVYPETAKRVVNEFYMDDLLSGCESVKEGIVIYQEMNDLLRKGGFELQKWMSNSEELLNAIKQMSKGREDVGENLKLKMDEVVKLLGITWNRRTDDFQYSVTLSMEEGPVTKRKIISHIARLYDPLGWVAPCVIVAKILIQRLWIAGLAWDDEVTGKLLDDWNNYKENLPMLSQIQIPRWVGTTSNDSLVELHGFSDASKLAFSATVYLRRVDTAGNVHVALVTAKTKVAPIKQVSIPRLELCGAVLLTRLLVEVAEILTVPKSVAHVSSGKNCADCASRGITPAELLSNTHWFNGPDFLHNESIQYSRPQNLGTQLEEVKVHITVEEIPIWNKFSSLTKLVRVVAYCRRFLDMKKSLSERHISGFLTFTELTDALETCIKQCQKEHFEADLELLRRDGDLARIRGPLKSLNPFIDGKGMLRVGGRLDKSLLSDNAKHPLLMPKKSFLTDLIIADAHAKTLHGGIQLMLAYLGTKYYILGSKPLVKAHVRKCVKCVRHSAGTSSQLMGQLPAARVTPTRAFKCSGVDYAGPINIRTSKGRGHQSIKGYICIFVCMVTRAVHIEVVSDLTTSGFLAAFKRFVARRGHCTDIWSDNGTNFVGASRELRNLIASENSTLLEDVAKSLANNGTTWHFIPPHAPNFGGLWEAGVRAIKYHLKRVIAESTLTYEELSTVLTQIEACLNSRPLTRLESESDSIDVLTPGHFLVGEHLVAAPDHNFEESRETSLRRWQLTQKMMQNFWRRWSQEYLTKFLHRYKWSYQTPEPKIGDIVLVKEDGLPPCRWLLGRVVIKHPGSDNVTRVVTLRTKNSIIKRPTSKLCVLPVAV